MTMATLVRRLSRARGITLPPVSSSACRDVHHWRRAHPLGSSSSSSSSFLAGWSPLGGARAAHGDAAATTTAVTVRHDGGDVVCAREVTHPSDGEGAGAITYVLGMRPSSAASRLSGSPAVFVDLPAVGAQLMPGRQFAMVEGQDGRRVTLKSPVTGEVVEVNEMLLQHPALAGAAGGGGGAGSLGDGWLVRVDPYLDTNDVDDPDFGMMYGLAEEKVV